jgi:hypothetical protein
MSQQNAAVKVASWSLALALCAGGVMPVSAWAQSGPAPAQTPAPEQLTPLPVPAGVRVEPAPGAQGATSASASASVSVPAIGTPVDPQTGQPTGHTISKSINEQHRVSAFAGASSGAVQGVNAQIPAVGGVQPWVALSDLLQRPAAYLSAFNGLPGAEWDRRVSSLSPAGESFLGRLHNERVTLNLDVLPPHEHLVIATDLYVFGDWRGEGDASSAPCVLTVRTSEGTEVLRATFANDGAGARWVQSYPQPAGSARNSAQFGAAKLNALKLASPGGSTMADSVYRLVLSVPHQAVSAGLSFEVTGLPGGAGSGATVGWGLDNMAVLTATGAELASAQRGAQDASARMAQLGAEAGPALLAAGKISGAGGLLPVYTGALPADTYTSDFGAGAGSGWSSQRVTRSKTGISHLGPFGNESVRFNIDGLPAHQDLVVAADVLVMGDWRGEGASGQQPSRFVISGDNGAELFATTFAQELAGGIGGRVQSFGATGGPGAPARTGAMATNTLGLTDTNGQQVADTLYRVVFSVPHSQATAGLSFGATGLVGSITEAAWGLSKLSLTARNQSMGTGQWAAATHSASSYTSTTSSTTSSSSSWSQMQTRRFEQLVLASRFDGGSSDTLAFENAPVSRTPSGESFVGPLHNERLTLNLAGLPEHDTLVVDVDLYTIGDWHGNALSGLVDAPSMIKVVLGDGREVFAESFANDDKSGLRTQSFDNVGTPGGPMAVRRAPNHDAVAVNTLGYQGPALSGADAPVRDASYRVRFVIPHGQRDAKIVFAGEGLSGTSADASWGVDNVFVTAVGDRTMSAGQWARMDSEGSGWMTDGMYINPFLEGPTGAEWSTRSVSFGPDGNGVLGPLHNQDALLTLGNLPEHTHLVIAADVITFGDWPGDGPDPSAFKIALDDGTEVFATSFASAGSGRTQSFPGKLGAGSYPPGSGAVGPDGLGGDMGWLASAWNASSASATTALSVVSTTETTSSSSESSAASAAAAGVSMVETGTVAIEPAGPSVSTSEVASALPVGHYGQGGTPYSTASAGASASSASSSSSTTTTTTTTTSSSVTQVSGGGSGQAQTYRMYFTVPHSASSATISFGARGLPGTPGQTGWGLDNVAVTPFNRNNPNNAFGSGGFTGIAESNQSRGSIDPFSRPNMGYNPPPVNPYANLNYPPIGGQPGDDNRRFFPNNNPPIPSPGPAALLGAAGLLGLRRARRREA